MARVPPIGVVGAPLLAACAAFGTAGTSPTNDGGAGGAECAQPHFVCEDFDHGPPAAPWNASNLGTSAATIASDRSVSNPSSLLATIGEGLPVPLLSVGLPGAKHVRCGVQIDLSQTASLGGANVLRLASATGSDFVEVTVLPTSLKVSVNGPGTDLPSLQTQRFTQIVLDVSSEPGGGVTFTAGGIPHVLALPITPGVAFTEAAFGLDPVGSTATWAAYFDDAFCDLP